MMTGHANLKHFFILIGHKNSAKSSVQSIIQNLLGDFLSTISDTIVCKTNDYGAANAHDGHLLPAIGKRALLIEELERLLAAMKVKKWFGGAGVNAMCRPPNSDKYIKFKWGAKLLASANPVSFKGFDNPHDEAALDRPIYLPFDRHFKKNAEGDALVNSMLDTYKEAVFAWILEGSFLFCEKNEIDFPQICHQAKASIRSATSNVEQWLDEECIIDLNNDKLFYPRGEFYPAYQLWVDEKEKAGNLPIGSLVKQAEFKKNYFKRFAESKRKVGEIPRINVYMNIALKPEIIEKIKKMKEDEEEAEEEEKSRK